MNLVCKSELGLNPSMVHPCSSHCSSPNVYQRSALVFCLFSWSFSLDCISIPVFPGELANTPPQYARSIYSMLILQSWSFHYSLISFSLLWWMEPWPSCKIQALPCQFASTKESFSCGMLLQYHALGAQFWQAQGQTRAYTKGKTDLRWSGCFSWCSSLSTNYKGKSRPYEPHMLCEVGWIQVLLVPLQLLLLLLLSYCSFPSSLTTGRAPSHEKSLPRNRTRFFPIHIPLFGSLA